jgi:PIN domain nuclease of toxin-antitoxin system
MNLLLDTHVFIWWITDSPLLSKKSKKLIGDIKNRLYFSVASAWEISIKAGLGKITFDEPLETYLPSQLAKNAIELLPIQLADAIKTGQLPNHHRDPFDRLLIAQSLNGDLPIISNDPLFKKYGGKVIW